jgi:hypothetical protein
MSTQRNSMTDKRQKSQYSLAFPEERRGAAPTAFEGGTESELAKRTAEATEEAPGAESGSLCPTLTSPRSGFPSLLFRVSLTR